MRHINLDRWLGLLLLILLVWGATLRLYHLDQRSMWVDELFTLAVAQYHPLVPGAGQPMFRRIQVTEIRDGDTFLTAKAAEQSPPLNDLMEKASVGFLGVTEVAARLPAALFACLLLVWFACFAWRHPDPYVRRVLGWSLFLLVQYPVLVLYAQEGRAYSMGVSLVGMAGLQWMLRWRDGWRHWRPPGWLEIVLFSLASYTHYNATLLVALLLLPDSVMAIKQRSMDAWVRLSTITVLVFAWLLLSAHSILYTSKGGVGWGIVSAWHQVIWTAVLDAAATLNPLWIGIAMVLFIVSRRLERRQFQDNECPKSVLSFRLYSLAILTLIYWALASKVASKAGMAHPRYYIFIVPFVTVMMAMLLAEIRAIWAVGTLALVFFALAGPTERLNGSINTDDFRSMAMVATKEVDSKTIFLYPLSALRDVYRVSLHRYLGGDPIERMVGINVAQDGAQVCEKLQDRENVAVVGHGVGQSLVNTVYELCGQRWSNRTVERFHHTFAERWRAE